MILDLVAIRRDLHRHPELSMEEYRTAQVVEENLKKLGLSPRRVAKTGVIADIVGGKGESGSGPLVALRADTDALPIHEETGLEFASTVPGVMHACGHDAHTAILLGAAERLVQMKEELPGSVRLLFQPAEEVCLGAKAMIDEGALDGVHSIYGLHNEPSLPVGEVIITSGPFLASSESLTIHVYGEGGHAAVPHLAIDPIVASASILLNLQAIVSRAVNPLDSAVISIGSIVAGNEPGIIPTKAEMRGSIRCLNRELSRRLPELIAQSVKSSAAAHRCTAEVEIVQKAPPLVNDPDAAAVVQAVANELLGSERVHLNHRFLVSEDFAFYLEKIPGCYIALGVGGTYGVHNPKFTLDEASLPIGADLLAQIARRALEEAR